MQKLCKTGKIILAVITVGYGKSAGYEGKIYGTFCLILCIVFHDSTQHGNWLRRGSPAGGWEPRFSCKYCTGGFSPCSGWCTFLRRYPGCRHLSPAIEGLHFRVGKAKGCTGGVRFYLSGDEEYNGTAFAAWTKVHPSVWFLYPWRKPCANRFDKKYPELIFAAPTFRFLSPNSHWKEPATRYRSSSWHRYWGACRFPLFCSRNNRTGKRTSGPVLFRPCP